MRHLPNSPLMVCGSIDRDCHKERAYLFVKNCKDKWINTNLSAGREYCCKDGVPYKCPPSWLSLLPPQQQDMFAQLDQLEESKQIVTQQQALILQKLQEQLQNNNMLRRARWLAQNTVQSLTEPQNFI